MTKIKVRSITELTWQASNQRLLPLAAGQALYYRIQFLHKTVLAVVPQLGVGLVTQPLLPKHLGIGNLGGLATGCC